MYCGNNKLDPRITNGTLKIGTRFECLRKGVGVGLHQEPYKEEFVPIYKERIYCGNKDKLPDGYDRFGSLSQCFQKGVGVGKKIVTEKQQEVLPPSYFVPSSYTIPEPSSTLSDEFISVRSEPYSIRSDEFSSSSTISEPSSARSDEFSGSFSDYSTAGESSKLMTPDQFMLSDPIISPTDTSSTRSSTKSSTKSSGSKPMSPSQILGAPLFGPAPFSAALLGSSYIPTVTVLPNIRKK